MVVVKAERFDNSISHCDLLQEHSGGRVIDLHASSTLVITANSEAGGWESCHRVAPHDFALELADLGQGLKIPDVQGR